MKSLPILALSIASLAAGATGYAQFTVPSRAAQYQQQGNNDNLAYRQGIRDGRSDAQRNRRMDMDARRWNSQRDRADYQAGYQRGYQEASSRAANNNNYSTSQAYEDGLRDGQNDAQRNRRPLMRNRYGSNSGQQRDYEAGYNDGYNRVANNYADQGSYNFGQQSSTSQPYGVREPSLAIRPDNYVTWDSGSQQPVRVFVQPDNNSEQLFAEGATGTQIANWMEQGHRYTFIMRDMNGREIGRQTADLRGGFRNGRRF
jgi:hypothetical protein